MNYFDVKLVVFFNRNGDIAQVARAPALQAGGPGFESLYLHQRKLPNIWRFSLVASYETQLWGEPRLRS